MLSSLTPIAIAARSLLRERSQSSRPLTFVPIRKGDNTNSQNGLLLPERLHTLFDQHYLTIEPNKKTLLVSRRIREQFENGRDYYALKERLVAKPTDALALPSTENLAYHFERFTELEGF